MSVGLDFAATVERRVEEGWASALATAAALEAYSANLRLLDRLLHMLRMQEPFTGGVGHCRRGRQRFAAAGGTANT